MPEHPPRIVVTGVGACTPLGPTLAASWPRIVRGESAIAPLRHLNIGAEGNRAVAVSAAAAAAPPLRVPKHAKYAGRAVTCGLHALGEAAATAGLGAADLDPLRVAVYGATGQTGLDVEEFFPALSAAWGDAAGDYEAVGGPPARLIDPHFSLRTLANGGLALVAANVGARGPSGNFVQGEVASAFALRAACGDLAEGRADLAVVFACDSLPHPSTWLAYERMHLLSRQPPDRALCPFDAARDGLVLGEAGAVVVLERREHAAARGAPPLADILDVRVEAGRGGWWSPDAAALETLVGALMFPEPPRAPVIPPEPSATFVVARGLGTIEHDLAEAAALRRAGAARLAVSAFKGATGYLGAATGLVEAAFATRALGEGLVPAVVHLSAPDPACQIDFVRAAARLTAQRRYVLACSAGWDGQWALMAFASPSDDEP